MTFKLTGWKAVLTIVAVVAFAAIRYNMQSAALQAEGIDEVRHWLALEAVRVALPGLEQAAAGTASEAYLAQVASDLDEDSFDVISVVRHGMGERIVARVEYRHLNRSPADATEVRYLRMSYSLATGWRIQSETTKLNYYLAAF